jgi:hypothetical protein
MGSIRAAWNAILLLTVLVAAILASHNAVGQGFTTGSIAGTIADQQGAVVPQAAITAVETASHATFKTVSGADSSSSRYPSLGFPISGPIKARPNTPWLTAWGVQ